MAVAACEFGFLGGSIGIAAGERLTRAVERATAERLPLICLPASGGTRMQEGTIAFVQMVKITAAVAAHKSAHLPYLVYLRHPTTGGVFASWASLGHLTLAEPGALIGFLGPRVYQALYGVAIPRGRPDGREPARPRADRRRDRAGRARRLPGPRAHRDHRPARPSQQDPRADPATSAAGPAWESVLRTRRAGQPAPPT